MILLSLYSINTVVIDILFHIIFLMRNVLSISKQQSTSFKITLVNHYKYERDRLLRSMYRGMKWFFWRMTCAEKVCWCGHKECYLASVAVRCPALDAADAGLAALRSAAAIQAHAHHSHMLVLHSYYWSQPNKITRDISREC